MSPLERLRVVLQYQREDVARQLGVTSVTVWRWERGGVAPDLRHAVALAELYEVPLESVAAAVLHGVASRTLPRDGKLAPVVPIR